MAIDTSDGRHIGNCMYYDINAEKLECELGIMIGDRDYWSQGYGTDVVKTALAHIFTTTELERVYLHTLSTNFRAQKSFTKSGFKPLRDVRRDGYEFILMEIWRKEWEVANPVKTRPQTESSTPFSTSEAAPQPDTNPLMGS
jgi:RimJ/RimL family protein N-acetyltransferase